MKRWTITLSILTLLAASALPSGARTAPGLTVPVVRCPTGFGFGAPHGRIPAELRIRAVARGSGRLVAYTNTIEYLIGPPGLNCAGGVGVDGSGTIVAWPRGQ